MLKGPQKPGPTIPTVTEPGAADASDRLADEELFETYLAARVQQGVEALESARTALTADAQDPRRTLLVIQRIHELRDLRQQLDSQRERVNTARRAAGVPPAEPEPVISEEASAEFRATQAERAAKIMTALRTKPRTCPSCQALLEPHANECVCGWKDRRANGAKAAAGTGLPGGRAI